MSTLLASTNVATAPNVTAATANVPHLVKNKTASPFKAKRGRSVTTPNDGKGSKSVHHSAERLIMSDTSTAVLVAPIASQENKKVFVSPPGPRAFPGRYLDRICELITVDNPDRTEPFMLNARATPHIWYVFFIDPHHTDPAKRSCYDWARFMDEGAASLFLTSAPGWPAGAMPAPIRTITKGKSSNGENG